jgi:hypothetical protein
LKIEAVVNFILARAPGDTGARENFMSITVDDLFPSPYLKAADLKGQRHVLTISKITSEEIGKEKKRRPVLYFQKCTKGLVLNKTNARKVAEVAGSRIIDDWVGKPIALYPKMVEFAGELVEAIRIDYPTPSGPPGTAATVTIHKPSPTALDNADKVSPFEELEQSSVADRIEDDILA